MSTIAIEYLIFGVTLFCLSASVVIYITLEIGRESRLRYWERDPLWDQYQAARCFEQRAADRLMAAQLKRELSDV